MPTKLAVWPLGIPPLRTKHSTARLKVILRTVTRSPINFPVCAINHPKTNANSPPNPLMSIYIIYHSIFLFVYRLAYVYLFMYFSQRTAVRASNNKKVPADQFDGYFVRSAISRLFQTSLPAFPPQLQPLLLPSE